MKNIAQLLQEVADPSREESVEMTTEQALTHAQIEALFEEPPPPVNPVAALLDSARKAGLFDPPEDAPLTLVHSGAWERRVHRTREEWLNELAHALRPTFEHHKSPLPSDLRLSCGYPSNGGKGQTIGECHSPIASADGTTEIFVRPDLHDPLEVGAVVLHELCHAALGTEFKHGKVFKRLAIAVGLEGKMKATTAGPAARTLLRDLLADLGPYPHGRLGLAGAGGKKPSKPPAQKNVTCRICGFAAKIRVEQMEIGRLVCPADDAMLLTKEEGGEGDE